MNVRFKLSKDHVKFATNAVVGAGVFRIINSIIENNVNSDDVNAFGKLQVKAGTAIITRVVIAGTSQYTDAFIDTIDTNVSKLRTAIENKKLPQ